MKERLNLFLVFWVHSTSLTALKLLNNTLFYSSQIPQLNFGDGLETIGDYAFSNLQIYGGYIGTGLKYIGTSAFNSFKLELLMCLGTQEECNAIEITENNDAINGKVVFLRDTVGENLCVFVYDREGYFLGHEQYIVGTILNMIPNDYSSDDYAGTIDLETGKLIKDFTMPTVILLQVGGV